MLPMPDVRSVEHELSIEQSSRLLQAHRHVSASGPPADRMVALCKTLGGIMGSKVALLGRRGDRWVVLAESVREPRPRGADLILATLSKLAGDPWSDVVCWRPDAWSWTLVRLPLPPGVQGVLMILGDWTRSSAVLEQLGHSLVGSDNLAPREAPTAIEVAHRMAQGLTRVRGKQQVCELVLRYSMLVVPSRLAAFAVPTDSGELSIVATNGYPLALVESLRIAPGSGVIGEVFQRAAPIRVTDVKSVAGLSRRRSRYRTDSFVAVPVLSGPDVLGVLCVTDRSGDALYSQRDMADLSVLMVPAALALARERAERKAVAFEHAAIADPGSGLFNRAYFQSRFEEELQRSARQGTPVSLLMIDIDAFKSINDTYGHLAGDSVIRDVADILRRSVRVFDVCARYGGEEFVVMMPGSSLRSATLIAERIRRRIETYHPRDRALEAVEVTVSIGVSESTAHSSARDVVEQADGALYAAKRAGKNQVKTARLDVTP